MKEELFATLCMECIAEEVKEMSKSHVDGLLSAAMLVCMTGVLKKLEKKLKDRGLIDCKKGGEKK